MFSLAFCFEYFKSSRRDKRWLRGQDVCILYHVLYNWMYIWLHIVILLLDQDYLMLYQFTFAKFQFYHLYDVSTVNAFASHPTRNCSNLGVMKFTIVYICSIQTHLVLPFHYKLNVLDDIVLVLLSVVSVNLQTKPYPFDCFTEYAGGCVSKNNKSFFHLVLLFFFLLLSCIHVATFTFFFVYFTIKCTTTGSRINELALGYRFTITLFLLQ